MAEGGEPVVSPLFGAVVPEVPRAAPAGNGGNLLASALSDLPEQEEIDEPEPEPDMATGDEDEEDLYATFADAVKATVKMQPERHGGDAEYVASQAIAAGCLTLPQLHDWVARQHMQAARSGFRAPNPRHFPEPEIVQLVKYLRYAETARKTL